MASITDIRLMINGLSSGSKNVNNSKKSSVKKSTKSGNITMKKGFNEAGTLAKIASARTKSQASAIERSLRMELKDAKRFDCDAATIRSIKKAIGKANGKFKAMSKEESIDNNRRVAKNAKNRVQEKKLRDELEQKKRVRESKERADVGSARELYNKKAEKYRDDSYETVEGTTFDAECYEFTVQNTAAAEACVNTTDGAAGAVIDQAL